MAFLLEVAANAVGDLVAALVVLAIGRLFWPRIKRWLDSYNAPDAQFTRWAKKSGLMAEVREQWEAAARYRLVQDVRRRRGEVPEDTEHES